MSTAGERPRIWGTAVHRSAICRCSCRPPTRLSRECCIGRTSRRRYQSTRSWILQGRLRIIRISADPLRQCRLTARPGWVADDHHRRCTFRTPPQARSQPAHPPLRTRHLSSAPDTTKLSHLIQLRLFPLCRPHRPASDHAARVYLPSRRSRTFPMPKPQLLNQIALLL